MFRWIDELLCDHVWKLKHWYELNLVKLEIYQCIHCKKCKRVEVPWF